MQTRTFFQSARQAAGKRDLEAVEDPRDTEGDDYQRVKASPREAIEPRRDICFNDWPVRHPKRHMNAGLLRLTLHGVAWRERPRGC